MYLIENNGRVRETNIRAEARFFAWLSVTYCIGNVYRVGAAPYSLCPFEI
jgi:hypothetical protein